MKFIKSILKFGLGAFAVLFLLGIVIGTLSGDEETTNDKILAEEAITPVEKTIEASAAPTIEETEQEKIKKLEDAKYEKNSESKGEVVSLEDSKVDDFIEEDNEDSIEDEYQEALKKQQAQEEEKPIETKPDTIESTDSSFNNDDLLWAAAAHSDTVTIATTLGDISLAVQDLQDGIGSMNSLTLYAEDLEKETAEALYNSNKYTVSSDLSEAQSEYNSALSDYNKAAKLIIEAMDSYNQGDESKFSSLVSQSTSYLNSGTDHSKTAKSLIDEFNENHQ